ncbi:NAD-dependent epimerase/dehydratase family protein [Salegentibacter sp. F188]|uniref:NAD-dependent epimerase/dehydratase family protein n=1 Tax=Autumnicola patrickiae TaxID=3075591 RepID=A0ABU3E3Z7_9FLAO|nr:NAD-dependent epimerase/dehydratase family protein [Salegentibacter sp. F188]MDT0690711.1 NAD-dependent epimerase/dehydratase family protein [Salegentibacter sp. F188]
MILVTGGTGLVGSHLLFDLARSGEKVRAIHRESSNLDTVEKVFSYYAPAAEAKKLFNTIEWVKADILNIPALKLAFLGIDFVYHCAALVSFDSGDVNKLRQINITGTANVVNLCISNSVKKLCHVSSTASLGKPLVGNTVTEKTAWNPEENHRDYAISKYGAEIEVWRGTQEGVDAVIVNPGIIIGPGFWDAGSGPIFKKLDNGLNYHFPKVTGFVNVKDVVKAMQQLMASEIKNEQYILVSENRSFKYVLEEAAASINKPAPRKKLKKWMIFLAWIFQSIGSIFGYKKQVSSDSTKTLYDEWHFSNEKIMNDLNFRFQPIAESIRNTGKIYKKEN